MKLEMEEEEGYNPKTFQIVQEVEPNVEPRYVCKCLTDDRSSEEITIPARKQRILSTVTRTEEYLRERRIPELTNFLLIKVVSEAPEKPIYFLENLLNDCMLYRAGHGAAPVIYEDRHLEAVIKSFDPGHRGWLTAGQIHRAYTTLGLIPDDSLQDNLPTDIVLNNLKEAQKMELFQLVSAGKDKLKSNSGTESSDTTTV